MPYTYFRKKIFRKYVLIFTFFICLEGGSVLLHLYPNQFFKAFPSGRAIRCKASLPSGLFLAIPNALCSGYTGREV